MSVKKEPFYEKAAEYWSSVPATLDGVLGGFAHISDDDIKGSKLFIDQIFSVENPPSKKLALDCGAGIGRVTKFLLLPIFETVDLVEQNEEFINTVPDFIGDKFAERLGDLNAVGLQDFVPVKKYDLIWCQWVLGHLNDHDLYNFLVKCSDSLNENGVIVLKENVTSSGELEFDKEDSSVTRSHSMLLEIITQAKLKRIKESRQKNFPKGIYPVYMMALRPKSLITDSTSVSTSEGNSSSTLSEESEVCEGNEQCTISKEIAESNIDWDQ